MVDIDHIFGADGADRAIAVDRDVDRPVLPQLHRLRQAIGGKAARTIFADVLLVRGREQPRPRPGREVETEPRGACLDRLAVVDLVAADEVDVRIDREASAEAVTGREVERSEGRREGNG